MRISRHLSPKFKTNSSTLGEEKKVVVSESFATSVRRCLIHILPILTSIAILTINTHGVYIGFDVSGPIKSDTINLMFFQLLAKAHELMIVASLSLIVLQAVRHELLFGDGLPLGLIGSGLAFSNFEFFFRKEFYGALQYLAYHGNKARKIGFVVLLVVSGLIAVLAGPASAVLLVPKAQTYPAGGTDFYLNGSMNDFWPEDLSGDISDLQQYCSSENSTTLGICPAGGYFSLWARWGQLNYTNFISQNVPSYAKDLTGSRFYWPVQSPTSAIPPLYALGDPRPDDETFQTSTFLVQAHAASAIMLQHIATDWWEVLSSQLRVNPLQVDDRNVKTSARSVISAVRCAEPQNISASDTRVQFPTIESRWNWAENAEFAVDNLNTTATDHLRFHWVHLPDEFGTSSIGGVFETPWDSSSNTRVVVGCSAQTGWVPTDLFTDSYTFWSGWYPWGVHFGERTPSWTAPSEGEPLSPTNGRIALGDAWLELLTPPAPVIGFQDRSSQTSTIESILESAGLADISSSWNGTTLTEDWLNGGRMPNSGKARLLEAIICSILVDGLSRSGSHRVFNTTGPSSEWSLAMYNPRADFKKQILSGRTAFESPNAPPPDFTTLHVTMQISGFAYRVTLAGFLSMLVLLTHIAMALTHMFWVVCHKRTSRSWSSISELIALSQNSQPAFDSLANTGAGIHSSRTFACVAKIRLRPQPQNKNLDHVELVFEDFAGSTRTTVHESTATSTGATTASSVNETGKVHEVHKVHKGHGSWTFPLNPNVPYLPANLALGSMSSSSERLIPKVHLADGEKADVIGVNHAYS